jgi:outer membrane receptor protein involved in Fe transport
LYGVELTVDYALDDTWQVGGYLTLSAADYTDYCSIQAPSYSYIGGGSVLDILSPGAGDDVLSSCGVVDGNQLSQHSPFTANFNVSASLPETMFGFNTTIRLDLRHKGKHYEDHLNLLERAAVTTSNLSANMRSESWTVRAFVNNLTDNTEPGRVSLGRDFINNANPTLGATAVHTWGISPTRPREIGVQVEYNF